MKSTKEPEELQFPYFSIISASAGSGKTYELAARIVRFLLDERIRHHDLSNILAITFTNNAAAEMKQRVLRFLKSIALGVEKETDQFKNVPGVGELQSRASKLLDDIFSRYDDIQIQTIDSFMVRVLRSSAVEFGYHPGFELKIESRELLEEAFERTSRRIREGSDEAKRFSEIIDIIDESRDEKRYHWNPFADLQKSVIDFYRILSALPETFVWEDLSSEIRQLLVRFESCVLRLHEIAVESGCELNSNFEKAFNKVRSGDIGNAIMRSYNKVIVKGTSGLKAAPTARLLEPIQAEIEELKRELIELNAQQHFYPLVKALGMMEEELDAVKKERNQLGIEDLGKMMYKFISRETIPSVYIMLGEQIHHYLIDEFQDTSPMQWESMKPLFEEALSIDGSLSIVGDMKQSIFGFRGADWRIMHGLIHGENPFPSAERTVRNLPKSYRSGEHILEFHRKVFHEGVGSNEKFVIAGNMSGLTDYDQQALDEKKDRGYVEIRKHEKNESVPERSDVLSIISDCVERGYRYGDIAILSLENDQLITASEWLNLESIPFISHSSLDLRRRKSTGEMIALLRFLDANVDDLSFATFLFGDVFEAFLHQRRGLGREALHQIALEAKTKGSYLYKEFRHAQTELWEECLAPLNRSAGYLPAYDLLCEAYRIFRVYDNLPREEATLTKLLESVIRVEHAGASTLKGFLKIADERYTDEALWNIKVPKTGNAVTLMTFHKAKGLDFPVVVVLLYEKSFTSSAEYFIDRREDGVRLIKISSKTEKYSGRLHELYEANRTNKRTDELNKLYVGLTRAKDEMYVLNVSTLNRDGEPDWDIPSVFLPSGYETGKVKPPVTISTRVEGAVIRAYHHAKGSVYDTLDTGKIGFHEKLRGEVIHAVLEDIEFMDDTIEERIHEFLKRYTDELTLIGNVDTMKATILEALAVPDIAECFARKEGRRVIREQEFVSPQGDLYRADRVIVDRDRVVVIDFKTGGEEDVKKHREQVRGYMSLIADLYPGRRMEGRIAYIDRKKVQSVERGRA